MAFESLKLTEVAVGKPVTNALMEKIKYNFDYLYGLGASGSGAGLIPNASFEIDSDEDGIPDQWTRNLYAGGSGEYEVTDAIHGKRAYKFVHPGGAGNGGGYLTSDYIEAAGSTDVAIYFFTKTSNIATHVKGQVLCYDKDKIALSGPAAAITFYTSVTNTIEWQMVAGVIPLPDDTRYMKVRLCGGVDDTDEAGDIFFDFVQIIPLVNYMVGDTLLMSSDGEVTTNSTTYIKLKELTIQRSGAVRIKYAAKRGVAPFSFTGNTQIYKNDLPVGTEREVTNQDYITYSEDIAGFRMGDTIAIYGKMDEASIHLYVKNFRLYIGNVQEHWG